MWFGVVFNIFKCLGTDVLSNLYISRVPDTFYCGGTPTTTFPEINSKFFILLNLYTFIFRFLSFEKRNDEC